MASTSSSSLGESLTPSMNATPASTNTNSTSIDTSSKSNDALVSAGVMVVDESPGSRNAPTSSSDKKTTKLSTSEPKDLNSSSRLSVGIEMEDETSTTTTNTVVVPVNANDTNDNNSQASHLDEDEGDVDDDEIVTEEVCSATTIETDVKNKTSSVGDVSGGSISHNDEELHDFSSSSASSAASTSSRNLIKKFSARKTIRSSSASNNNNIDATVLDESEANKLMQTLGPHIPIISSGVVGSRKREHNRRKCSEPMSVKKLPRMRESDEEDDEYDFDFFDDDGEDFDEDFEIGRSFGYFDLSTTSARNRRKTRSSTRSSGSTGGMISTKRLNELMAVSGAFGPLGVGMEGTNDELSIPGSPLLEGNDFGMKDSSEEKDRVIILNSSDGEFETCITETQSECNVKWKNHEAHILSAFEALLESETFCDVTLVCDIEEETKDDEGLEDDAEKRVPEGGMKDESSSGGVRKLKAHKIILSACSEYFQRIFADSPCKHSVIVLKDFQAWEIQALLDFMYRGEVDVSLERLDILVKSAESLQIRGLLEAIAKLGPDPLSFTSENQRIHDTHGICDPTDCMSIDDYTANERSRMSTREMTDSHISPVWDDGALNLSMDMKTKEKSSSPDIMKRLEPLDSPQRDSPHQVNLCMNEIPPEAYGIIGQSRDDRGMKDSPGLIRQSSLFEINHMDFGFQERDRQNSRQTPPNIQSPLHVPIPCEKQQSAFPRRKQARPRRRSGDFVAQDLSKIPSNHPLKLPNEDEIEVQSTRGQSPDLQSEYNGSIKDLSSEEKREQDTLKSKRVELSPNIPIQLEKYREDFSDTENAEENPNGISLTPIRTLGEVGGGGALMSRLVHRRPRSSRRFNEDNGSSNPMNLRHSRSSRSNNSHHRKDGNEGERVIINEESPLDNSRGLDYTTGMNEGNHKKLKKASSSSKLRGISSGGSHLGKLGFPGVPPPPFPPSGHLPFLRNWSPTMSQLHNNTNAMTMTPPPGLHRNSPIKPNMGDSDDGISSAADHCQSPPLSPFPLDPKHLLSNSRHPHEFPLFGMHQDQQQQQHHRPNLPSPLTFNKHSPPSPSSFFMNPLAAAAAMSLKPMGANRDGHPPGGDEPGGDKKNPSTPPDLFPGPGFPMGLPLHLTPGGHLHVHGIHPQTSKDDRDRKKGHGKGGGPRNGPLGWPGLPLGPPPIFGRHRAQHSAPRGGPPRAWSNADLTEALHNVWNKKMTTSQASRIFGIPYNSLLMYVRGKYGKSLKLDLLKKGLDQAMENSQKALKAAKAAGAAGAAGASGAASGATNPSTSSANTTTTNSNTPSNNGPTSTPNSESTSTLTTTTASTTSNNNNHSSTTNSNSSPSSVKGHHHQHHHHHHHANLLSLMSGGAHNERNNNNTPPTGMGHLHPHHLPNHHHHHNKSSKSHNHGNSSHNTNNHSIELPHELPPGFNPFSAASLFGEYPNPFPFASALSHILPQANLVNQQQHTGNGSISSSGGHSNLGLSLTNHSSRKDSLKSEISVGDDEK